MGVTESPKLAPEEALPVDTASLVVGEGVIAEVCPVKSFLVDGVSSSVLVEGAVEGVTLPVSAKVLGLSLPLDGTVTSVVDDVVVDAPDCDVIPGGLLMIGVNELSVPCAVESDDAELEEGNVDSDVIVIVPGSSLAVNRLVSSVKGEDDETLVVPVRETVVGLLATSVSELPTI